MKNLDTEILGHCDDILKECPAERVSNVRSFCSSSDQAEIARQLNDEFGSITLETLISLNSSLKKARMRSRRADARWSRVCSQAFFLEDIIKNQQSENDGTYKIKSSVIQERTGTLGKIIDTLEYLYYVKLHQFIYIALGILTVLLSAFVLLGEVLIFIKSTKDSDGTLFSQLLGSAPGHLSTQVHNPSPFELITLDLLSSATALCGSRRVLWSLQSSNGWFVWFVS
jgi:hypothetical protein